MAGKLGYQEWDAMQEHVGRYKEAGWMLDQYVCSCGWESYVYFDGYVYARDEWRRHEADNSGQSVDN